MADPGVSSQNFWRLLLEGGREGASVFNQDRSRAKAQAPDLFLALQNMMRQKQQRQEDVEFRGQAHALDLQQFDLDKDQFAHQKSKDTEAAALALRKAKTNEERVAALIALQGAQTRYTEKKIPTGGVRTEFTPSELIRLRADYDKGVRSRRGWENMKQFMTGDNAKFLPPEPPQLPGTVEEYIDQQKVSLLGKEPTYEAPEGSQQDGMSDEDFMLLMGEMLKAQTEGGY